ncbi:alpha/beta hydrolase [Microbacterium sp. dk485]|uniref:alpha/beta fold hydrolase n=1 Tax=Microbacterium sp. dk485 TaxID=2560021 RepID=UPI0010733001|nr:alpha/beta fold hydrolase [Microbacterium sp. dk485]TFV84438.1 alpha/beta hydrolase [Microbacterium sp. dk485]
MDVILVPGLWLDASSWADVSELLAAAGHRPSALTLQGLHSRTANRNGIWLADHVAAIVAAIDQCEGKVVVVGHAEACGLVHAAVSQRPDGVACAIHVGGFPSADGARVLSGFTVDARGVTTHTAGLSAVDPGLGGLHRRMSENASHVLDAVQRLTDDRRFAVPATVVATEFTTDDVRRWVAAGIDPVRELARISDLTLVDLPSGRWPQIERPRDLAEVLLAQLALPRAEPEKV